MSPARQVSGRLAPPPSLNCDRKQLTSYSGNVTCFERSIEQTRIDITTDWGGVEAFNLHHPEGQVDQHFLLWGKPFQAADWSRIEIRPGQLIEGMKAIVWVCGEPAILPVVDGRPIGASDAINQPWPRRPEAAAENVATTDSSIICDWR